MALLTRLRSPLVATALIAAALSATCMTRAEAQGFGFFGNLFGGGVQRHAPPAPAAPGAIYAPRAQPDLYYDRPRHRAARRKPAEQVQAEPAPKEPAKAEPKNASMFVYVLGDSMGQLLANGLDEALAERPDVAVIHRARGSTGLVTADFYDWPKAVGDLLAGRDGTDLKPGKPDAGGARASARSDTPDNASSTSEASKPEASKPEASKAQSAKTGAPLSGDAKTEPAALVPAKTKIDVAVMMIGTNDRQALQVDGRTVQPGTPAWTAAYTRRVMVIDEAFRARKVPLVWVGIPITKDNSFADTMAALNDIYRDAATKTGAIYVDTWEAFSDDNGDFSSYGPDVNGQTVRLRAADGIHFTRAGARKLAHFVEAHVGRALDGKTPLPQLPTGTDDQSVASRAPEGSRPDSGGPDTVVVAARPDAGPIRNLNELPSAANGALATLAHATGARDGNPNALLAHGSATAIPSGRADDAHWSGNAEP